MGSMFFLASLLWKNAGVGGGKELISDGSGVVE